MKNGLLRLFAMLFLFFSPVASLSSIVDPNGPRNPLLIELAGDLDRYGIDVRLGSNERAPVPARPLLMPLSGFHSSVAPNFERSKFGSLFFQGVLFESALFAVDDKNGRTYSDPLRFLSMWKNVDAFKRVFVSFSSLDSATAQKVVLAFQAANYSVFVYTGRDAGGKFNAVDTGNYFREAGHRFVVDTDSSRSSNAVAVEAMLAKGSLNPVPYYEINKRGRRTATQLETKCCKVCRVFNGVRTEICGPVICGQQCRDAK